MTETTPRRMTAGKIILLILLWFVITFGTLLGWIGSVFLLKTTIAPDITANEVLNGLLVLLLAVAGLPLIHAGLHRYFWKQSNRPFSDMTQPPPPFGAQRLEPVPRTRKTAAQWTVYVVMYLLAVPTLVWTFGPLRHQLQTAGFLSRFSAGSASFGSLMTIVTCYLPAFGGLLLVLWATSGERRRMDAGGLDPAELLRLRVKHDWLASFTMAFGIVSFLSFWAGLMILRHM